MVVFRQFIFSHKPLQFFHICPTCLICSTKTLTELTFLKSCLIRIYKFTFHESSYLSHTTRTHTTSEWDRGIFDTTSHLLPDFLKRSEGCSSYFGDVLRCHEGEPYEDERYDIDDDGTKYTSGSRKNTLSSLRHITR